MSITFLFPAAAALLMSGQATAPQQPATPQVTLEAALSVPGRSDSNKARDPYRHPVETLGFFGVKPTDTVVELWPGGGWYTEILAPYLAPQGKLHLVPPAGRYDERIRAKLSGDPVYRNVTVATFTGSPHRIAAHLFMNHLLDAHNSAANTNLIYYMGPNAAAKEFIDPAILEDPTINPDQEIVDKLEELLSLDQAVRDEYLSRWQELRG